MGKEGLAIYNESTNELEVTRPGQIQRFKIKCTNLDPKQLKVYGVEIHGDEIWVLTSPKTNSRPTRKYIYKFSSLNGGASGSYS